MSLDFFSRFPELTSGQIQKMEQLTDIFLEWNAKINLSAIRNRNGVFVKHVLDSLLILPFHLIENGQRILDVGTGGGFPGLVLAIAYPASHFTLLDSTGKKIKAVDDMIKRLRLNNVQTVIGRAEILNKSPQYQGRFDRVLSRALAPFPTMIEYCLPFVKPGGKLIAYQGPNQKNLWNYPDITDVFETLLPEENTKRFFVVISKKTSYTKPTSSSSHATAQVCHQKNASGPDQNQTQ